MSTLSVNLPEGSLEWRLPSRGRVGMYCLIAAELAIFTIFVVAYLFYIGKSLTGPKPADVLHPPILYTICLLSSSLTIHLAVRRLSAGRIVAFGFWWLLTIVLGGVFLFGRQCAVLERHAAGVGVFRRDPCGNAAQHAGSSCVSAG